MLATIRKQLRHHPALIPLFIFIGGGAAMSMAYLARLGLRNPDVCWDRKNNPEPWNKLGPTDQYKVCLNHISVNPNNYVVLH
uniref:Cytochrome c oxidase subunit NDUFA4 n=1 Tax=Amphiprion percula TaxID=161767 RepID=A0A3P8RNX0_AMPPE